MSYDKNQARDFVGATLEAFQRNTNLNVSSVSAVNLLLGTMAVESDFGKYLWQIRGPALGAYQIEPATFRWLLERFSFVLDDQYGDISPVKLTNQLIYDLRLSTIIARLRYWVDPNPLPEADDIWGLARYWKRVYNTHKGAGTPEGFVSKYKLYVE